jgi:hypothetical protein
MFAAALPFAAELGGNLLGYYLGGQGDFSGGGEKTLKSAQDYIQQMGQQAIGQLAPYQQAGYGGLQQYMQALQPYSDPSQMYSQIMGGYQMSPAAQFQQQEGIKQLQNAMGARGMAGSGQEMKDILGYSQGLASQDMQQYLQNILGMGQTYLGGEAGLGQMGMGAAGQMGQFGLTSAGQYGNLAAQLAQTQAQAEAQKVASQSGLGQYLGEFGGGLGGAISAFL